MLMHYLFRKFQYSLHSFRSIETHFGPEQLSWKIPSVAYSYRYHLKGFSCEKFVLSRSTNLPLWNFYIQLFQFSCTCRHQINCFTFHCYYLCCQNSIFGRCCLISGSYQGRQTPLILIWCGQCAHRQKKAINQIDSRHWSSLIYSWN